MELIIKNNNYKIGKMNVFTQLHITRRLAPAFIAGKSSNNELLEVSKALQSMNDDDMDFIVNSCLSVCQRQESAGWQRVQSAPGTLQYADIELDTVIRLCVETIKDNLGNFFQSLEENEGSLQAQPE